MNTYSCFIVICGIGCFSFALGQDGAERLSTTSARTSIPYSLAVPEFAPPAPAIPKSLPSIRVDAEIGVPAENSRTLTIIRGEASTLPDLPPPVIAETRERLPLTPEQIARNIHHRRHRFHFGATVYDHRISQVQWHHPDTGKLYEAVCGFVIGLLAGIGRFVRNGESYDFMLMSFNIDTAVIRRVARQYAPRLPEVQMDAIMIIKGDRNDPVGISPITLIKDLVSSEKDRLVTYQADRLRYQQAAAAWEKAHPVPPRDETFLFRPHRGSRYLANPKPEAAVK